MMFFPAMDIIAAHRVPLLETIAMTPAIESMIMRNSRCRLYFDRMGWQVLGADHFAYGTSDFLRLWKKPGQKALR